MTKQVYVGMGGNIGDTVAILNQALDEITAIPEVSELRCSNFYQTTPVGFAEQPDYVNAVCGFTTTLNPKELHKELRRIEHKLGKLLKQPKNYPRIIDLDFLFYGSESHSDRELKIPHPYWHERLFVLLPLSDLTTELEVPLENRGTGKVNIEQMLATFPNIHDETVTYLTKPSNLSVHA